MKEIYEKGVSLIPNVCHPDFERGVVICIGTLLQGFVEGEEGGCIRMNYVADYGGPLNVTAVRWRWREQVFEDPFGV